MDADVPFPLGCFPLSVRETILAEFKGRHPSLLDVARVPDRHWLALPSIGPRMLTRLRSFTQDLKPVDQVWRFATLTQAQRLTRQRVLEEKLKRLQDEAKVVAAELSALNTFSQPRQRVRTTVQGSGLSPGL